jgi:hypothetical protein
MKARISAKGYTNVILVINMKRFIAAKDQKRFENIRGTPQFADVLRNGWWNARKHTSPFVRVSDKERPNPEDSMSTEQVGFATGVFRSLFLEEHVVPTYELKKELIKFPSDLEDNFQFRALFMQAWKSWKIYIRPTVTGMLVIRLTREYRDPRELIKIAEDVLHLHESLDVQSARAWIARKKVELKDNPDELKRVDRSVKAFLKWLGSNSSDKSELLYNPVQWKIAMEVASLFVKATGEIPIPNAMPVHLEKPEPRISNPLHDSYVIFHIDELYADETIVIKTDKQDETAAKTKAVKAGEKRLSRQIPVLPEDLNRSPLIKRAVLNLLEGAILEHNTSSNNNASVKADMLYFPNLRWQNIERILENNLASWMEEICLLTSRAALIIPSRKYKKDNLLVSTTPGATLKVKYARYWGAIERMIEFSIEIRTLAQLVERASYESLEEIANTVHTARETLQAGDIELDGRLPQHVKSASNLRRLAALSQGMSDPLVWSRSEYSILKAKYLLDQLGVPTLLTHIDRNISSLNSLVDHVDELYALDLAEKNNDMSAIMTLGLTALSLILTLIMLPSFWTDIQQINTSDSILSGIFSDNLLIFIGYAGTFLGFALIAFSLALGFFSLKHLPKIWKVIRRSLNRLGR